MQKLKPEVLGKILNKRLTPHDPIEKSWCKKNRFLEKRKDILGNSVTYGIAEKC